MLFSLLYTNWFLRWPEIQGSQGLISHLKREGRSLLLQSLWDLEASIWPFGCSPLSRSYFLHLACHANRAMGERKADGILKSPPQISALCRRWLCHSAWMQCSCLVSRSACWGSWYFAILAIWLFLGKNPYPSIPSYSLFTITVWRCIINTLKELCHCLQYRNSQRM